MLCSVLRVINYYYYYFFYLTDLLKQWVGDCWGYQEAVTRCSGDHFLIRPATDPVVTTPLYVPPLMQWWPLPNTSCHWCSGDGEIIPSDFCQKINEKLVIFYKPLFECKKVNIVVYIKFHTISETSCELIKLLVPISPRHHGQGTGGRTGPVQVQPWPSLLSDLQCCWHLAVTSVCV